MLQTWRKLQEVVHASSDTLPLFSLETKKHKTAFSVLFSRCLCPVRTPWVNNICNVYLVAVTRVLTASEASTRLWWRIEVQFSGCAAARNYLRDGGWTEVRPLLGSQPEALIAPANAWISVTTNERQPGNRSVARHSFVCEARQVLSTKSVFDLLMRGRRSERRPLWWYKLWKTEFLTAFVSFSFGNFSQGKSEAYPS